MAVPLKMNKSAWSSVWVAFIIYHVYVYQYVAVWGLLLVTNAKSVLIQQYQR